MVNRLKSLFFLAFFSLTIALSGDIQRNDTKEIVILIHGIRGNAKELNRIETFLTENSYIVYNIEYPSIEKTIQEISSGNITEKISEITDKHPEKKINFVTHSMGGIILRHFLQNNSIKNLGRVVMITPPNQGSEVTEWLKNNFVYKWRYGISGQQLGYDMAHNVNLTDSVSFAPGVIAGRKTQLPFFSWFIKGQDDGKISVKRTKVKGMKDFIILPYAHDNIINKKMVLDEILSFLKTSEFSQLPKN